MTTTESDIFARLTQSRHDPTTMLSQLADHFRSNRQPLELFETLKMGTRNKLGLPLIASDSEPPRADEVEQQLESGLLDACREAGVMLIEDGRISEGWMYLRPTGDTRLARQLIANVPIDDENYDAMIQTLLHEGVDVERGYQAVLDHQGTCNSITLYDQSIAGRSKSDRRLAAARLLDHFYDELTTLVRGDIARREAPAGDDETLAEMLDKREWILGEGGYHLDATHLSSTIRIASVLEEPSQLQKAWELTQYGRRLHHQLQYPGEEPFVDFYPAYATFYSILLGNHVDAGLKLFERRARNVDPLEHGTGALETYVELLDRTGHHLEAIRIALELVPEVVPPQQMVPMLIEIAGRHRASESDDANAGFDAVLEYCGAKGDLLGAAAALHAAES